jgi:hypothetical protein
MWLLTRARLDHPGLIQSALVDDQRRAPLLLQPEFVIFMVHWLAGGGGRCGHGPAVGAATATRRRYGLVPDAGRMAGRSKLRKASGVRKAVISWICAPRRVSTSMARGVKVCALSSQA